MKCKQCGINEVIDYTDNVAGLCTPCRWADIINWFSIRGKPKATLDMDNMPVDERSLDWQRMIDQGDRRMEDYE